ncbi:hypothetical protein KI688_006740 [Linnemannia hyalina]|uniref:Uncharacterized protein n=1 Tax=Linnemannia hyalina TaxID=64524 RepID=A0A9P8BNA2_9FUNG|nr:hypothetical protein KI688_006740 [Linnemannia hyalina]
MNVQCSHCGRMCVNVGHEVALPVRAQGQEERLFCKQCRQRMCMEKVVVEEVPARLLGYANEYCGQNVVPMLTKSEAKMMYNLRNRDLETIPIEIGYPVSADGNCVTAFLVNERDVLLVARGVHGLQVGVDNARFLIGAAPFPEEDILNRRDAIRTLFLQRRYFARSDLPRIQAFVQGQQGGAAELLAIVHEMAI